MDRYKKQKVIQIRVTQSLNKFKEYEYLLEDEDGFLELVIKEEGVDNYRGLDLGKLFKEDIVIKKDEGE